MSSSSQIEHAQKEIRDRWFLGPGDPLSGQVCRMLLKEIELFRDRFVVDALEREILVV